MCGLHSIHSSELLLLLLLVLKALEGSSTHWRQLLRFHVIHIHSTLFDWVNCVTYSNKYTMFSVRMVLCKFSIDSRKWVLIFDCAQINWYALYFSSLVYACVRKNPFEPISLTLPGSWREKKLPVSSYTWKNNITKGYYKLKNGYPLSFILLELIHFPLSLTHTYSDRTEKTVMATQNEHKIRPHSRICTLYKYIFGVCVHSFQLQNNKYFVLILCYRLNNTRTFFWCRERTTIKIKKTSASSSTKINDILMNLSILFWQLCTYII